MLTQPLPDLARWVASFRDAEIPVFRATATSLAVLRAREDDTSPAEIAEVVQTDPLMTLRVLAFAGQHRSRRVVTDSETVTSSLVLMGVSPFFRSFGEPATVEDLLGERTEARAGLDAVLHRSFRASRFALGFAVVRIDTDAEVLAEAALLHGFAEMLLWCHAPRLALEIARRQREAPGLRSADAQRAVLGITLADLQHGLMEAWRLPRMLVDATDRRNFADPRVRNVLLAVDLARHTQKGWDDPALGDDFRAIGELLRIAPEQARLRAIALDA